jgi:hypothetical protein
MAEHIGDICHAAGRYTKDGEERTSWVKLGVLFRTDKGYRIKMDAYPAVTTESDGWLNVFPKRDQAPKPEPAQQGFRKDKDSDIPF